MPSPVVSRCSLLVAGLLCLFGAAPSQSLDRIIAVVDDEVILQSELDAQVEFFALNNRVDPATPGLRERVLESMISEKLIIAKAIEDSVTVTDEEVNQQMDAVLQQRIQQVGSEARLEELYGMPISRIRREFRDEMRNPRKSKLFPKVVTCVFSGLRRSPRSVRKRCSTKCSASSA